MGELFGGAGTVLVIAPHPDDEVLGCGGTIARLSAAGREVHVAIATTGQPPRYDAASVKAVRDEAAAAHALLGVTRTHYLDLPAAELDRIGHADINRAMDGLFEQVDPETVLMPFIGDIHLDHQLVFRSCLVAARPSQARYPTRLYAYETLSETNWAAPHLDAAFCPSVYVDITDTIERKLAAFRLYASQCRAFPNERSSEALQALATLRGATVHRAAAEAFVLIREVT